MSILDKNITEEEKVSGYNPAESGDETFKLEQMDSYPGILPDFSYEEEPLIPSESLFQDDDIEDFDNFESINDDEITDDFSDDIEGTDDFDLDNFDVDAIAQNDSDNEFSGVFEDSDEELSTDFYEFEEDEVGNDSIDLNEKDDSIETLTDEEIRALQGDVFDDENTDDIPNDKVQLDDELKNILQADINKSQKYKNEEFDFEGDFNPPKNDGFPIDEDMSADVMNFDSIQVDKPSNYGIEQLEPIEEEKTKDELKEEKKKKSKRMVLMYSGVAVILLAALLITAIMNKDAIFQNKLLEKDSTLVEENNLNNETKSENQNDKSLIKQKQTKDIVKFDSIANENSISSIEMIDSNLITKNQKEVSNQVNNTLNNNEILENNSINNPSKNSIINNNSVNVLDEKKNLNTKSEVPINNEKTLNKKSKVITESPNLKSKTTNKLSVSEINPNIDNKEENEIVSKTKVPEKRNNSSNKIIENKKIKKETNTNTFATPKTESIASNNSKSTYSESTSKSVVPYPKKSKSDEGLFIVQVYASQSKEDAVYWVDKLKKQNINDAFISEQIIRDEIWYRVRFGNFTNKNEALETAAKLGYAQTWVDRVK